jgi:hypothetical protein
MTEKLVEVGGEHASIDQMRRQFSEYEHHIREYLRTLDATVESYKFAVEKDGEAFTFDVAIRATVRPKRRTEIPK